MGIELTEYSYVVDGLLLDGIRNFLKTFFSNAEFSVMRNF